ncbi:hypothetical protein PIB30_045949 [Stylosanthes scabra]|uniref:Uncharacterized protein n=1 Tax=Stylosanthes scabra TaxID=79078 RepID=A0ABU6QH46_9FABA|nr:hypothetical protein [Stylosanthes scabra]
MKKMFIFIIIIMIIVNHVVICGTRRRRREDRVMIDGGEFNGGMNKIHLAAYMGKPGRMIQPVNLTRDGIRCQTTLK